MKYGRVVEKTTTSNVFPLTGIEKVSMGGVEARNDMTAYPTEVQEKPVEPVKEETPSEEEEVPSADTVIADLAAATARARKPLGKK